MYARKSAVAAPPLDGLAISYEEHTEQLFQAAQTKGDHMGWATVRSTPRLRPCSPLMARSAEHRSAPS